MEPPNAQTGTLMVFPGLVSILAYSKVPRIHLGTITGCNHTRSKPSASSSSFPHSTARCAFKEPERRPPIWLDK